MSAPLPLRRPLRGAAVALMICGLAACGQGDVEGRAPAGSPAERTLSSPAVTPVDPTAPDATATDATATGGISDGATVDPVPAPGAPTGDITISPTGDASPGLGTAPGGDIDPPVYTPPAAVDTTVQDRADRIADAWREDMLGTWQAKLIPIGSEGFVPEFVDEDARAAWLVGAVSLPPDVTAPRATITAPDGERFTPHLLSAHQVVNRNLNRGADGTVVVTKISPATTTITTNHGEVEVPAYTYLSDAFRGGQATLAAVDYPLPGTPITPFADSETGPVTFPDGSSIRYAQDMLSVDGATLEATILLGACDVDTVLEAVEYDDLVVLVPHARTEGDACTLQLVLQPMTVTLDEPLGNRLVVEGARGQLLLPGPPGW